MHCSSDRGPGRAGCCSFSSSRPLARLQIVQVRCRSLTPERLAAILAAACHLGAWLERELTRPVRGEPSALKVVAFAQRRLTKQPSLAALAAYLGVSASTASRRVRKAHGCTWPALVTRLRNERAERLLLGAELPLAQIAARCGLTDASHLHRLFPRLHACTPQQWRERARRDGSVPGIA